MLSASILIFFLMVLAAMTYQDIVHRSIPIYFFLIAFALSITLQYLKCGVDMFFMIQASFNLLFVLLNALIVYIYVCKIKKISLHQAIGLGDLAFYLILIPLFSTPVFMAFHLISLVIVLVGYPLLKDVLSMKARAVPLAGLQSFCLLVLLIVFEFAYKEKSIIGSCSVIHWMY